MFGFLKDILGVPRPVKVVGYEEPEVVLECESPLDLGVVDVLAEIAGVKVKAQIQILESGSEQCRGLWIQPAEALPLLVEVFTPNENRRNPRFRRRLRVRSPQLSGFQGNSVDLSRCGMRLVGQGRFELGDKVNVNFELDDARGTELELEARVCWLAPAAEDGWIAIGLHYLNFDDDHHSHDFSHYKAFLDRIGSDNPAL